MQEHYRLAEGVSEDEASLVFNNPTCKLIKGVFVLVFCHFFGLAFTRSKSWMTPKVRSWEAHGKVLQASCFWGHQFLDLPKANKKLMKS
jgi:hypothetical protein